MSIREEAGFAYFMEYIENKSTEIKTEKIKNEKRIGRILKISIVTLIVLTIILTTINHYWPLSFGAILVLHLLFFTFILSVTVLIGFELTNKYREAASFSAWLSEALAVINSPHKEKARQWLENFRTQEDTENKGL